MHYLERRKDILNLIMQEGSVKAEELAKRYAVGVPTIRRDLKYLAEEYGIEIAYGGAYRKESLANQHVVELNITQKRMHHLEDKRFIAKKAAAIVEDGDTIALNAGSSVELVLDYLEGINAVNIVTLSLNVALRASTIPGATIYMPGGKLRNYSGAFYGSETESFLKRFNIDKAFLGVVAVSINKGVTHPSLEEVKTNQILADISRECYLLADHSKFDKTSLIKMYDLSQFHGFILDEATPEIYREYARNNDIIII
ncbi:MULTISPECIES: DeoR/GlpR family DNA-binding transcription regulator [Eubacterium]|uniref:Transcriptional regulator, DeoR family n=1 Tax=Eubacterium barkeri TaxID=1528 RepID=A0A1H3E158_EUBBA|nr:DeoR/GlpR family DNA-binding transcription regulator [Eubacterium barkeri]SDX72367.1 transcriptional regulator, DeoR family [Eubacterium barkeri]